MVLEYSRVSDADGARTFHELEVAASALDHPGLPIEPVEDVLGILPDGTPTERIELELVRRDGAPVAGTFLMLPIRENLHIAHVHVCVTPEARSQGIGRAVAERQLQRVRDEGRTTVVTFIGAPLGTTPSGQALAEALGAAPALESIRRSLDVRGIDDGALDVLRKEHVGDRASAYDVVQWVDRVPDELVDRAAEILPHVLTDSPRGDLDFEDERWDAERFRGYEATIARRGRRLVATGAVERSTGRLVAYTELTVAGSQPRFASQWGTIVEHDHRGHRLGVLVKLENLRQLRRESSGVELIDTWNAAENHHMVAVNELLGFRAVERYHAWQLSL